MKIFIELPSWLGDTVMATPALENLVKKYENPEITLMGSYIAIESLKHHPAVNQTYISDKGYLSILKLAKNVGKFDIFFSFRSSFRSKVFKLFINSKKKYQYSKDNFQNLHQVEKYNEFINESLNTKFSAGHLNIHSDLVSLKKTNFNSSQKLTLGINPGASYGKAKCWYPEEFAAVAAKLSSKFDINILGGPNDKNIAMDIETLLIKKGITNFKNLAGTTSINELIKHISNLDLFITGDSGPMHIAACYQIPTISIFGPTRDNETSQWMNAKSIVVKKSLDCQPCMKRTCPLIHHNCMKLIKAKDVLKEVESFNL